MFRQVSFAARPFAAMLMVVALSAGPAVAQTKVSPGFNLFSPEQDVQIGQESAAAAEQQLPLVRDGRVQAYVNDIGQKLARNAGGPAFQYQFKVVNASDINAFALPGGFIYVNRGVLEQAHNEGEVAGVLAHEISHVALRHGTHQASKAYGAQAGLSILGGLLGGKVGSGTANILNAVGGTGLNALFLKYSRDLESQADIRGAQILAASGYSPADMVNFFHTLESVDSSKKTNWLSDHPAPPDRINRIQKEAQMLRVPANPATNVAELRAVQGQLRGLGTAPGSGQIAQGTAAQPSGRPRTSGSGRVGSISVPAPSSTLARYTSRSRIYQIGYPSNWKVYEEGNTGVTIAPPGGVVDAGGRTEVVYGAIVNHYDPFGNVPQNRFQGDAGRGAVSLEDASSDLIAQIQQGGPHLRVVNGSTQRFTLDGGNALAVSLQGTNAGTGIAERVTVVTRQLADGHLIYLLFVTPQRDAASYGPVMQAMVRSLQVEDTQRH